jgi:hypothetical protein
VSGTTNQITATTVSNAVTLSLPSVVKIPGGSTSPALQLPASTTNAAPLHFIPTSAVPPSTPTGGDIWDYNAVLTFYANGMAQNIITDGANTLGSTQIAVISSQPNQLVTEGPTIDGSGNLGSLGNATGSGNATFNTLVTAPGSGAGVGSIQFYNTGATPTFASTLTPAAAPASNFTLSLPDTEANDTLVSLAYAQTLSSKTLSNALFVDGAHSNATLFTTSGAASAVNYFQIANSATGVGPQLTASGSDTNINALVIAKGTGSVNLRSNAALALAATNASSSAVNYASVTGSVTGTGVSYGAGGSDTNINVVLSPKGTGSVVVQNNFKTGTSSNTDIAGQLALSSGTASYSFTGSYTSAPICVATDASAQAAVGVAVSTSTLTITGNGSHNVNYICVGRN